MSKLVLFCLKKKHIFIAQSSYTEYDVDFTLNSKSARIFYYTMML